MTGLVLIAVLATAITVSPQQLREQLATDSAARYQQQITLVATERPAPALLIQLRTDPALSPLSRDWLLHQLVIELRQQPGDAEWQQVLQLLTEYQSPYVLAEDFEGRQRAIALTPIAEASRVTLAWWQQQQHAEQLQQQLDSATLSQLGQRWPTLSASEQSAWQLAIATLPATRSSMLTPPEATTLAKQAPELTAALAIRLREPALASALVQHDRGAAVSQLLADAEQYFDEAQQLAIYLAASKNAALRSQSWFHLGRLNHPDGNQQLKQAAAAGDRSAIAAWITQQGELALPELQRWLSQPEERSQLSAIYGLRLLASPAAEHSLQQFRANKTTSARVRQELQP